MQIRLLQVGTIAVMPAVREMSARWIVSHTNFISKYEPKFLQSVEEFLAHRLASSVGLFAGIRSAWFYFRELVTWQ